MQSVIMNKIVTLLEIKLDFKIDNHIIKSWIPFIKVIEPIRIHNKVQDGARKFLEL